MNTVRSVGYGWGVLIVAGAGSYYVAKRVVNSDRTERADAEERRRQETERLQSQEILYSRQHSSQASAATTGQSNAKRKVGHDDHLGPSKESIGDPAPVTHAQEDVAARGKYEATEPFRARKGDRFS